MSPMKRGRTHESDRQSLQHSNALDKILSDADVKYRLAYPTDSYRSGAIPIPQGQHSVQFQATYTENIQQRYDLRLSVRNNVNDRNRRPEIVGRDWLRFVREKHLKSGDRIILTKEVDEANAVRYSIRAQTRLFGQWITIP
ncbi:hypothetical protein GH714_019978 [Hevea brasiliensis]|uniref:TF-B3 domain-containing protein n=1 Tax=Hevea brasiliensis TaxID=3981 RepID=A0A6A6N5V0_HEVBR|nr:hypothetical protein GH714_019978 [Hevea brasiliensis]